MKKPIAAVVLSLAATFAVAFPSAARAATGAPCSASAVLQAVGDAVTTGSDGAVLAASVAGARRLKACGNERDAISAELIAADAYGDTNRPAARCDALADARRRSTSLGDSARARSIARAASGCHGKNGP